MTMRAEQQDEAKVLPLLGKSEEERSVILGPAKGKVGMRVVAGRRGPGRAVEAELHDVAAAGPAGLWRVRVLAFAERAPHRRDEVVPRRLAVPDQAVRPKTSEPGAPKAQEWGRDAL